MDWKCPKCRRVVDEGSRVVARAQPTPVVMCRGCLVQFRVIELGVGRRGTGDTAAGVGGVRVGEGEASCFFHPARSAVGPCDVCGRLICGICEVPLEGRRFCPTCVHTKRERGEEGEFERERPRWDLVASRLAVIGALPFFWFVAPITGLAVIVLAIWKRKSLPSRVDRSGWHWGVAWVLALVELVGALALFTFAMLES